MKQSRPIRVFFSPLSRRFYATRAYKIDENGLVTVTGEQFDVTNDIAGLIAQHGVEFIERGSCKRPEQSAMTKAELRAWIRSRAITQAEAAQLLGLSPPTLVRQITEAPSGVPVSKQTAIIVRLLDENRWYKAVMHSGSIPAGTRPSSTVQAGT
jgi:predicted DNA-binding protein (UPF0251 family)